MEEENDIPRPTATIFYEAKDVLVEKETGKYFLRGKYGGLYFIGQRKLTDEEENRG